MTYDIYRLPPDNKLLEQGDILDANKLRDNLKGHQDYYAEQQHFRYYMVLTQTCDLARGGIDFIFLSAVRSLNDSFKYNQIETSKARNYQENFLRDLYRHQYNKRGYFYLPCNSKFRILEDSVVDLRVMFSLHKAHYSDLCHSRICALEEIYAAQVGQIAGHMFSRIAIPENKIDIGVQTKKTLKKQGERYRKRLNELNSEFGEVCAVPDCGEKAVRFRSLPFLTENQKIKHEDCVLCIRHAKQWDEERILPWD